jgi:hypothetical protein
MFVISALLYPKATYASHGVHTVYHSEGAECRDIQDENIGCTLGHNNIYESV